MEFKLNKKEIETYVTWREELEETEEFNSDINNASKWGLSFTFGITGIGDRVIVKYGPHQKDITDYDSW